MQENQFKVVQNSKLFVGLKIDSLALNFRYENIF